MELFLLVLMFYLHILDDYKLQGILASMKQESWWKKQEGYSDFYANDFIMAIFEHGLCWSISVLLPLIFYDFFANNFDKIILLFILIFINAIIHSFIDHLKANKRKINLVTDQLLHFCQISFIWFFYFFV